MKGNVYEQTRTRTCSKPDKCIGESTEKQTYPSQDLIWNKWTNCTCSQRIRHRYPKFIAGCVNDCPKLKIPHYEVCEPIGCPTLHPTSIKTNGTSNGKCNEFCDFLT